MRPSIYESVSRTQTSVSKKQTGLSRDKYSGSTTNSTHLGHTSHCKATTGKNWSDEPSIHDKYSPGLRPVLHGGKFLPFFRYSALTGRVLVQILSCCILVSCRVSFSFLGMSEIDEGLERPEIFFQRFRSSALSKISRT